MVTKHRGNSPPHRTSTLDSSLSTAMSRESPLHGSDHEQAQATPLDILLNAIQGSNGSYPYTQHDDHDHPPTLNSEDLNLDGLLHDQDQAVEASRKRAREDEHLDLADYSKRRRELSPSGPVGPRLPAKVDETFSTIQVWHPRTGQKSYGKERRMLNPPPTLRVAGPLLSLLTCATLSTTTVPLQMPSSTATANIFSSQTHTIPLISASEPTETGDAPPSGTLTRREQREMQHRKMREQAGKSGFGGSLPWERERITAQERHVLTDGLTFPGLFVGEAIGKHKEFQLELRLATPGVDYSVNAPRATRRPGQRISARQAMLDPLLQDAPDDARVSLNPLADDITPGDLEKFTGQQDPDIGKSVSATAIEETQRPQDHMSTPRTSTLALAVDQAQVNIEDPSGSMPPTWATLSSAPLAVVSKPSQKTGRARSMASCLNERDNFALIVRINSQTVRTKYMKLENDDNLGTRLTSRTGTWSPFRFDIIKRAPPWEPEKPRPIAMARMRIPELLTAPETLTYGSIISIVDVNTGIRSEPVKLVHVERNEVIVGHDEGHPVSELHRVAFVRYDETAPASANPEPRYYLSAPGARAGGGELLEPLEYKLKLASGTGEAGSTEQGDEPATLGEVASSETLAPGTEAWRETILTVKKKRRTRRIALAKATLEERDDLASASLAWQQATGQMKEVKLEKDKTPRKNSAPTEPKTTQAYVERVEDWMCWVITSVDCFSYTFFDGSSGTGNVLTGPIDPVPRLLARPALHQQSRTLDLLLSPFPSDEVPDIYLGSIGPLPLSVWRSAAPRDSGKAGSELPAVRVDGNKSQHPTGTINGRKITTSWPSFVSHSLVVAELPDIERIQTAMEEIPAKAGTGPDAHQPSASSPIVGNDNVGAEKHEGVGGDSPWLADTDHLDTGELTIQEALRNAEDALQRDLDLSAFDDHAMIDAAFDAAIGAHNAAPGVRGVLAEATIGGDAQSQAEDSLVQNNEPQAEGGTADGLRSADVRLAGGQSTAEMAALRRLPLLLVRRSDGVGFALDHALGATQDEDGHWKLEVVSSANGLIGL